MLEYVLVFIILSYIVYRFIASPIAYAGWGISAVVFALFVTDYVTDPQILLYSFLLVILLSTVTAVFGGAST